MNWSRPPRVGLISVEGGLRVGGVHETFQVTTPDDRDYVQRPSRQEGARQGKVRGKSLSLCLSCVLLQPLIALTKSGRHDWRPQEDDCRTDRNTSREDRAEEVVCLADRGRE